MRVPGGGASCLGVGRPGSGALPPPTACPLGGLPGPTGCGCGGVRARGPVTNPTARALACCGGGMREPGGGASCLGVGRPGTGALPTPAARPLGGLPGPTTHLLWVRGGAGVGARLSLAPCPVPRFVVCCARFPGSRHPVAVVAWHLSSCHGCGRQRASLACLVAPRWCAAPRPVRSLSGYWVAARGTRRPAENRAHCACRWPLARQGRWARSASYPFGVPQWGCPWRVPPASVLGCVRCGGLACVDPVTDASGFPYRPSCDGGLGRCTGAVSCGRRHRPLRVGGRHARVPRVCACACPAWPGRAGRPPWRLLGRLSFPLAVLGSLFACSAPSGLGLPRLWLLLGFSVFFCFFSPFLPRCAPVVSCFACFPAPCALGLGVLSPPPFLFSPPPSLCAPLSPALRVFRPGVPWALASCCPRPSFPPPPLPCCLCGARRVCVSLAVGCASVVLSLSLLRVRWLVLCGVGCWARLSSAVSWWVLVTCFGGAVLVWPRGWPPCGSAWCFLVFRCPVLCSVARCCRVVVCCRALPFVCVVACACCLFLAPARLLCVFWGVVLCVRCPARLLCCARRPCCFLWLLLLVPGVAAFCWGSAGGSGCPALSFGGVCQLWCPCLVWPSLGVFPVVSCSPVLCPPALC